jgi:hypothetical protein
MKIRYATHADLKELIDFLRINWSENHVFVKNPELLLWQHGQPHSETLNFVLAEHEGSISAILGFIPSTRFDPLMKPSNISLAIWAKSQSAPRGSGVLLLKFLEKRKAVNSIFAIGLSDVVKPIYRKLGYRVSEMKHYAIVNSTIKHFALLKLPGEQVLQDFTGEKKFETWINESTGQEELKSYLVDIKTVKTFTFINARYIEHPVYNYKFAFLGDGEKRELLIIFRIQSKDMTNVLRIVDVLGDQSALSKYLNNFQTLLAKYEAEYLHFYTSREIDTNFVQGCVIQIDPATRAIVPNYFEPYADQNVFLDYCIKYLKPIYDDSALYLGDSDQDRPNIYIPKVQIS